MANNHEFKGGLTRYWWIPLLTGLLSIFIGIWCLGSPATSLPTLALFFAGCICAGGLLNLCFGIANSGIAPYWGWNIAIGILEIICGGWLFTLPTAAVTSIFIYVIGVYLIVAAFVYMFEACAWLSYSKNWVAVLLGFLLVTLLLACIFLSGPVLGGIAVWLYIGFAFISMGIYRLASAARLQKINSFLRSEHERVQ